ncbi:hypothetical protein BDW22DRAFT_1354684 [Trametopsis cervina]|nr:hypothetical protein BDW22DRAFT_1354684 [Trametopsis cervina]
MTAACIRCSRNREPTHTRKLSRRPLRTPPPHRWKCWWPLPAFPRWTLVYFVTTVNSLVTANIRHSGRPAREYPGWL